MFATTPDELISLAGGQERNTAKEDG